MSVDIIPEGRTVDPLKIAYEELIQVYTFLGKKEDENPEFSKYYDLVGNVLDQFTGFCSKSVMLDSKYPDDPHVEPDLKWRKSVGVRN
jgi:hypothetical protein